MKNANWTPQEAITAFVVSILTENAPEGMLVRQGRGSEFVVELEFDFTDDTVIGDNPIYARVKYGDVTDR